jgi:hypothetical protein
MNLLKPIAFGLALLAGLLLMGGCSPRRGYEAALVLADIAAREQPSRLKRVTPAPQRQAIAFSIDGRPYRGDLYLPGDSPRSALRAAPRRIKSNLMTIVTDVALFARALFCMGRSHLHAGVIIGNSESLTIGRRWRTLSTTASCTG